MADTLAAAEKRSPPPSPDQQCPESQAPQAQSSPTLAPHFMGMEVPDHAPMAMAALMKRSAHADNGLGMMLLTDGALSTPAATRFGGTSAGAAAVAAASVVTMPFAVRARPLPPLIKPRILKLQRSGEQPVYVLCVAADKAGAPGCPSAAGPGLGPSPVPAGWPTEPTASSAHDVPPRDGTRATSLGEETGASVGAGGGAGCGARTCADARASRGVLCTEVTGVEPRLFTSIIRVVCCLWTRGDERPDQVVMAARLAHAGCAVVPVCVEDASARADASRDANEPPGTVRVLSTGFGLDTLLDAVCGTRHDMAKRQFNHVLSATVSGTAFRKAREVANSGNVVDATALTDVLPDAWRTPDKREAVLTAAEDAGLLAFSAQGGSATVRAVSAQTLARVAVDILRLAHRVSPRSKLLERYKPLLMFPPHDREALLDTLQRHGVVFTFSCFDRAETDELKHFVVLPRMPRRRVAERAADTAGVPVAVAATTATAAYKFSGSPGELWCRLLVRLTRQPMPRLYVEDVDTLWVRLFEHDDTTVPRHACDLQLAPLTNTLHVTATGAHPEPLRDTVHDALMGVLDAWDVNVKLLRLTTHCSCCGTRGVPVPRHSAAEGTAQCPSCAFDVLQPALQQSMCELRARNSAQLLLRRLEAAARCSGATVRAIPERALQELSWVASRLARCLFHSHASPSVWVPLPFHDTFRWAAVCECPGHWHIVVKGDAFSANPAFVKAHAEVLLILLRTVQATNAWTDSARLLPPADHCRPQRVVKAVNAVQELTAMRHLQPSAPGSVNVSELTRQLHEHVTQHALMPATFALPAEPAQRLWVCHDHSHGAAL